MGVKHNKQIYQNYLAMTVHRRCIHAIHLTCIVNLDVCGVLHYKSNYNRFFQHDILVKHIYLSVYYFRREYFLCWLLPVFTYLLITVRFLLHLQAIEQYNNWYNCASNWKYVLYILYTACIPITPLPRSNALLVCIRHGSIWRPMHKRFYENFWCFDHSKKWPLAWLCNCGST